MDTPELVLPGIANRVAVVTGGGGAIGGAIAAALGAAAARVAIWDLAADAADARAAAIVAAGGQAIGLACDVTDPAGVAAAAAETAARIGPADILVNAAGGSSRAATTSPDRSFFDLELAGIMGAMGLNYAGTLLPCQVFAQGFADRGTGVILNLASIAGLKPLSRAVGYSDAKAAVTSFTRWLAVHLATEYAPGIRVNALAPGFVLTTQNRFLLVDERTGQPTERGERIVRRVPLGRYGRPEEMVGAALWLVSDAATYVTGAVVPVDGGLTASFGI